MILNWILEESSPMNWAKSNIIPDISDKEKDAAEPNINVLFDSEKAMYVPLCKIDIICNVNIVAGFEAY